MWKFCGWSAFDSIFSPKRTIILSSVNLAATCTIMHVMCNNIIIIIIFGLRVLAGMKQT